MSMHESTGDEYLREQVRVIRSMGKAVGNGALEIQEQVDQATARNVLHEDLGYFKSQTSEYNLNDTMRDKLIVHGRQDASHAVILATTCNRRIVRLQANVRLLMLLSVVQTAILIWMMFPRN